MPFKHWTILIVPPGNGPTRTIRFGSRGAEWPLAWRACPHRREALGAERHARRARHARLAAPPPGRASGGQHRGDCRSRRRRASGRPRGGAGAPPPPRPSLGRLGFGTRPDLDGMIARATELASSFRAVSDTLTRNFERL